jgi:hypothetical protein
MLRRDTLADGEIPGFEGSTGVCEVKGQRLTILVHGSTMDDEAAATAVWV